MVVQLLSGREKVSTLRLVLCHLVLWLVARRDTLWFSPESPATSTGFHQSLVLELTRPNSSEKDSKAHPRSNTDRFPLVTANKVTHPKLWK
jgi:hypothetical protein